MRATTRGQTEQASDGDREDAAFKGSLEKHHLGPSCRVKSTIPGCQREAIPRQNQRGGEMQRMEATRLMPKDELEGMLHKLIDLYHRK